MHPRSYAAWISVYSTNAHREASSSNDAPPTRFGHATHVGRLRRTTVGESPIMSCASLSGSVAPPTSGTLIGTP
ncbi:MULTISPECIES: hypothetical protein [unclassified Streptomyces]|uniref:hypothetical protein n=1 Tax=unclassified Streptomyces TaxID=2593676 RepID=UPI003D8BE53E